MTGCHWVTCLQRRWFSRSCGWKNERFSTANTVSKNELSIPIYASQLCIYRTLISFKSSHPNSWKNLYMQGKHDPLFAFGIVFPFPFEHLFFAFSVAFLVTVRKFFCLSSPSQPAFIPTLTFSNRIVGGCQQFTNITLTCWLFLNLLLMDFLRKSCCSVVLATISLFPQYRVSRMHADLGYNLFVWRKGCQQ